MFPEVFETLNPLLWAIIGAVLSAILSHYYPIFVESRKYKKKPELFGVWHSEYQGIDEPQGTWVSELLKIDTHKGKLRIKNSDSSAGYKYVGQAELTNENHIYGVWQSIKPGAIAKGVLVLTVSSQGDQMYGYWVGSDELGARRYGKWVLCRQPEGIEETKLLLQEMRKSRLKKVREK